MRTIVVQSWFGATPAWLGACLGSVAGWAAEAGVPYRRIDDALFDALPGWAVDAAAGARLALTDYARLLWIERLLARAERVVWIDADVLLWGALALPDAPFAVARERWIWREGGCVRALEKASNAVMAFTRGNALLPWYLDACATILRDAPKPLNRTALGPQLLTALHAAEPLPLIEGVPTLSAAVMLDLVGEGDGAALADLRAAWRAPVAGAHLCRSLGGTGDAPALVGEGVQARVVEVLAGAGAGLLRP